MKKLKLLTLTVALALAAGVLVQARQDDKTAAKPAPSVAGKWNMAIEMQGRPAQDTSLLEIKLDGKTVTGTIAGPQGEPLAIKGEFADGKLSFSMTFDSQNGPIPIAFKGGLKDNGTLAGTMEFGPAGQAMPANWSAERVKEKAGLR